MRFQRFSAFFVLSAVIFSCAPQQPELKTGTWRGIIEMQGRELPFTFRVANDSGRYTAWLQNDTEEIKLDDIKFDGDTVEMPLHIFDASLRAKVDGNQLRGTFVKYYAQQANLPFHADFDKNYLFKEKSEEVAVNYTGKYQVTFKTEKSSYPSVAVFQQNGDKLTGTFLTPTGDYRYLSGNVVDGRLMLSTFDGNHAYIFDAAFAGDSLEGDYYAGKSTHEKFAGVRNDNAEMPDPESLTYLKPGFDKLDFSFPDLKGNKVSMSDERFNGKVVILQIFGTWCPNCMDETNFLSNWYRENKDRGVEILGLAYERKDDFNYAVARIEKMKSRLNVDYDFVVAGTDDKEKAGATLPALSQVQAFPTTIFVGKDGKVKHIRTGFEGPGTGIYHEQFKERFNQIINEMLAEGTSKATGLKK